MHLSVAPTEEHKSRQEASLFSVLDRSMRLTFASDTEAHAIDVAEDMVRDVSLEALI